MSTRDDPHEFEAGPGDGIAALRREIQMLHNDYRYPELRFKGITALLDRIETWSPQRTTAPDGRPAWQHHCGQVGYGLQSPSWCPHCRPGTPVPSSIGWRALYTVAGQ